MRLIDPPGGRPWALIGLASASLLTNLVLVATFAFPSSNTATPAPHTPGTPVAEVAGVPAIAPAAVQREVAVAEAPPAPIEADDGMHQIRAPVVHSLARTFQEAVPENPDMVSQIYARLFVWDLDLRKDLQKGDEVAAVYAIEDDLADIQVASYRSRKLRTTLMAYRYQAEGDAYASWWDASGTEVPRRLVNGPLQEYQQVTSLLKDRPKHRGMDFKTPVGTPVYTPRPGTIVRTNWNVANNGGCLEVQFRDGTLARYLHLSQVDVDAGQVVSAGARLARTGNSGRSTAPHLHYELERGGRTIDPVSYHGVTRRKLDRADLVRFEGERDRLDVLLAADRTARR
jgi:murein DD-endopeptidase